MNIYTIEPTHWTAEREWRNGYESQDAILILKHPTSDTKNCKLPTDGHLKWGLQNM